jgi:universal stress protein A
LALPFHASITLLHVRQDTAERDETAVSHEMEDRLRDITDLLHALDLPAQYRLYHGDPRKAIMKTVEEDTCDLIVMGSYPRPDCSTLFARTATQTLLRHLPCPTLIVKKHKKQ